MSVLECCTGNATFSQRAAKVQVFFVPTRDIGGQELPLSVAMTSNPSIGIRKVASRGVVPAGEGMNPEVVGRFMMNDYDIPDGVILKLFCTRTLPGQHSTGNVFIRMRAAGPFKEIRAKLADYPKATINEAIFRGRFDVISPEEAAALGARVPVQFAKFYYASAVRAVFNFVELAPAIEEKRVLATKVTSDSFGRETTIVTAKTRRKLGV
jgi:hypothetical protein